MSSRGRQLIRSYGQLSRRTFVKGLAVGGAAATLGFSPSSIWAQKNSTREPTAELSGTDFDLRIDETPVNFTGASRKAITVNHSLPAPTLRWKQGDTVTLRVSNRTGEETSFHWHGILVPANMDGVPGMGEGERESHRL